MAQLKTLPGGSRADDDKMLMRSIVKNMTDEQLVAIADDIAVLLYTIFFSKMFK
jgi:hypothetical protein